MEIFVVIFALLIAVILNVILAKNAEAIAEKKGHNGRKWFHICFWLAPVSYVLVAALPDLNLLKKQEETIELLKKLVSNTEANYPNSMPNLPKAKSANDAVPFAAQHAATPQQSPKENVSFSDAFAPEDLLNILEELPSAKDIAEFITELIGNSKNQRDYALLIELESCAINEKNHGNQKAKAIQHIKDYLENRQ